MVLLDTCALLWLAADKKKLSPQAKRVIKSNAEALSVSSISAFEIAIPTRVHFSTELHPPLP